MPPKTGALLDPAAAGAFIEGYKRFLLTVPTTDRADEGSLLQTLVDARNRITKDPELLRDTLAQAGAAEADNLILTSADMPDSGDAIRHAKALNPGIHVLARAPYLRDLARLRQAGAEAVVSAEGEVGLALTEMILHRLGATPDQIDRERDRVRSEFRPL